MTQMNMEINVQLFVQKDNMKYAEELGTALTTVVLSELAKIILLGELVIFFLYLYIKFSKQNTEIVKKMIVQIFYVESNLKNILYNINIVILTKKNNFYCFVYYSSNHIIKQIEKINSIFSFLVV